MQVESRSRPRALSCLERLIVALTLDVLFPLRFCILRQISCNVVCDKSIYFTSSRRFDGSCSASLGSYAMDLISLAEISRALVDMYIKPGLF